jgi:hypothetical protein
VGLQSVEACAARAAAQVCSASAAAPCRFLGFDHPYLKGFRLLQQNGRVDTSRTFFLDESAPPAANSRADFSHHKKSQQSQQRAFKPQVTDDSSTDSEKAEAPTPQPSAAAPAENRSQQGTPELSPNRAQYSSSSLIPPPTGLPSPPVHPASALIRQQNPLFENDEGAIPAPAETRIPQAPRRSNRSNRGVIDRYDPSAYSTFTTGLPSMKHVHFNPEQTVWAFRPPGSPQSP